MAGTISTLTAGDLVVSISGDGDGSGTYTDNQASPITLEELTTAGSIAGTLVLPQSTTTNASSTTEYAISGEYGSSSEGALEMSGDGQSLVIVGYGVNAAQYNANTSQYGTAALAQTTSLSSAGTAAVARVIADISYNGTVDTSTALYNVFNTNNPRSVATVNGTSFYVSGQGVSGGSTQGVFLAKDGASSATAIDTSTDTRNVEIVNGELYASRDSKQGSGGTSNISDYGTTLPTGATAPTVLPGISQTVTLTAAEENSVNSSDVGTAVHLSPEEYFFANATTLYIADGGNPKEGGLGDGGLQKWTLGSNGTWGLDYTLSAGLNLVPDTASAGTSGLIGLTGTVTGNTVTLYTTNETIGDLDQTFLYSITDTLGATTASAGETFTTLLTAAADTNIRGIAFAPSASTAPCYVSGTRIATARGEVAVEDLRVGDRAVVLLGQGFAPVRWIGHRTLDLRGHPAPAGVQPVRIRAEAFGPGRPQRDLCVSPGHALFVDGVLIQAGRLVNGATIVQEEPEAVTYWHVELERHDVLLAEGLPAESYLDTGNRTAFVDGGAFLELHPDFRPKHWAQTCVDLVQDGPMLEAAKARLLERAGTVFGFTTTDDPALHLLVDGVAVPPCEAEDDRYRFHLPAGSRDVRLLSRVWVPSQLLSASTDTRRLGVCVRQVLLDGQALALDDARLAAGWDKPEQDVVGAQRWTRGAAKLPAGAREVTVHLRGFATYRMEPVATKAVAAA